MTPEQSHLFIKALAGIASVIAILLVIVIINRIAKKHAERLNAKYEEEMKRQKEEKKKKNK